MPEPGGVRRLVLEVTERCNHACLHCYNYWRGAQGAAPAGEELTRAEIRELIGRVKAECPLAEIALSGGEPLLRPDTAEVVQDLADAGLACVVITNGTRLTHEMLRRFPSGTAFEITLFSARREVHDRVAGTRAHDRVLEALARLPRYGCKFVLACVVTRLNAQDVTQTIELGIALGAQAVLLNRVNLSRRTLPLAPLLVPPADALRRSLDAAAEAAASYGIGVAVSVPIPPCVVDPQPYPELHFGWCPRGDADAYYTVDVAGRLRPCNHSSVVLGDLRHQSITDIVPSRATNAYWRPVPDACLVCEHPLKDLCRGGCPAAADECYGTRSRWDPFVDFARGAPYPRAGVGTPGAGGRSPDIGRGDSGREQRLRQRSG